MKYKKIPIIKYNNQTKNCPLIYKLNWEKLRTILTKIFAKKLPDLMGCLQITYF